MNYNYKLYIKLLLYFCSLVRLVAAVLSYIAVAKVAQDA